MMRSQLALSLVTAASLVWTGCIVEEETEERERFEDDGAAATSGAGGSTGAGTLETTVSTGTGTGGATGATTGNTSSSITTGVGGGGNTCNYDAPNSCLSADTVTEIAGDAGEDVRVISGTTERFIKVFVAETVGSVISYPDLKFTARLDNSPGMDFDLHVYAADSEPHCDEEAVEATTEPAIVVGSWNDDLNSDDGRWMVFEIVYAGGQECGQNAEWTLTIAGNCDAVECVE